MLRKTFDVVGSGTKLYLEEIISVLKKMVESQGRKYRKDHHFHHLNEMVRETFVCLIFHIIYFLSSCRKPRNGSSC